MIPSTPQKIEEDVYLVDKPKGISTQDLVKQFKEEHKARKVGHAGTLDPETDGAIIIAVNDGVSQLQKYLELPKLYRISLQLAQDVSETTIRKMLSGMIGMALHLPPTGDISDSKGEDRPLEVHTAKLIGYNKKIADIVFEISSGVPIKNLGHEIAHRVGTEGEVINIKRISIGPYSLLEQIVFAGGCFWCTVAEYANTPGVLEAVAGYIGGTVPHPTYEQVCAGTTGHREAVRVIYDPSFVSLDTLLEVYWKHVDPTDKEGQFADRGFQYTTAIYVQTKEQQKVVEASKEKLQTSGKFAKPIVTEILPLTIFYPAEEYHQMYHEKQPFQYGVYKEGSGRAEFMRQTWS